MESPWIEFRNSPTTYLLTHKISIEALVADMMQVLSSEHEKKEPMKLTILGIWQEMCHFLFSDAERTSRAISFLKDSLSQQKSGSSQLYFSQILCTLTTLVIEMQLMMSSHSSELADLVCHLLEKVMSDTRKFIKCTACDCLRELEMTYPGLLAAKLGHFHRLCVAESTYLYQSYMALFAAVLDHTVQKFLLEDSQQGVASPPLDILADLLSYPGPFTAFQVPLKFKETASAILRKQVPCSSATDVTRFTEVRRGVSFILDCSHLLTPVCLVNISLRVMSCLHYTSLSPKILKRLLQNSSWQDVGLMELLVVIRSMFGLEIYDESDEAHLRQRLMMLSEQASLPNHHRALGWQWLLKCVYDHLTRDTEQQWQHQQQLEEEQREQDLGSGDLPHALVAHMPALNQDLALEVELRQRTLSPSIFDCDDVFLSKCKALAICKVHGGRSDWSGSEFGPDSVRDLVVHLLKKVECGLLGRPIVCLYQTLYSQYSFHDTHTAQNKEIEKLILELVLKYPQLILITIQFIASVQNCCPKSPLPLNLMSEIVQFLASSPLPKLLSDFSLYLTFIKYTISSSSINPVVMLQLLIRVLSGSTLCAQGPWDLGNSLIEVSVTAMKVHPTEAVFKDLLELLQLLVINYNDLDIRDRARFYHNLLLTVSGDKLTAILTLASDSVTGSSLADIVEARISNSVFPSAPPICKLKDGSSFISLERVAEEKGFVGTSTDWTGAPMATDSMLKEYLQDLGNRNGGSSKPDSISLKYRISFVKRPAGVSSGIFALALKLSTKKYYHVSPDVHVPFLSLEDGVCDDHSSALITLVFYPKEPVPASFELSAVFSSEEGVTYSTMLSPINVDFTDLFLPIPSPLREMAPRSAIFQLLWKNIESIQHTRFLVEGRHGILSLLHLSYIESSWASRELRDFEVAPTQGEGKEGVEEEEKHGCGDMHRVMVFLPPMYHLLLKFTVGPTSANVAIATDNWRLLPLINKHLQQL